MPDIPLPPLIEVAPSPHVAEPTSTTRRMMIDVFIGMVPVLVMAVIVFHWYAVVQMGVCVLCCLATEAVCCWIRGKPIPLGDYSAAVTGVILGLSLPWAAPWYIGVLASVVAIGLGKVVFGGLGYNIFNPAMVGRAFVMLSFARELGTAAYVVLHSNLEILTQPTPLTFAKEATRSLGAEGFWPLFVGQVNGSPGETSAVALMVGGLYLCVRRSAAWGIPAGMLLAGFVTAEALYAASLTAYPPLYHLITGSFLFGAFFIATDPVTSPVIHRGHFLFGAGVGILSICIRVFSGYPEGVMFAVLLMNGAVPLINRWTIPRPVGGPLKPT